MLVVVIVVVVVAVNICIRFSTVPQRRIALSPEFQEGMPPLGFSCFSGSVVLLQLSR